MTQQLDLFRAPAPIIEQPCFILPDNSLILVQPTENPTGAEAAERRAARLREIKDREAAKTFERVPNTKGPRRWGVTIP